ncbi:MULTISPECIES: dihydroxyacetone kinase subunit DhaL [unclassified Breznakia]|uniref:dihydroxyacetone kinase subunit DhaL n=1 Tax=unclassified Breznakia TaxID=2623764 RepID=UPI002472E8F3|nr:MULTISPECIES: dihydroxyacetone kinase subunit DhaL [unclassified Breznakia]MDH6366208.1 dihydroxyacetone kinase-like protein [Breznakia sp. PH1-1]MDH6403301.1 dihydroxyacetone kinase-like protein [Breznakia sp. PF1-11]MDH6411010.1 dihydroxyacetone kinase-like protein [Breznakia sp. PFB1-11]MDH6413374.1 dihydroxyacetone kinase-like protein [Breznakia sp. PFB1-14]MDH6416139.1 dihydroxyacetone kinase-like protein [Breznakia sp. PFB1-4]
MKFTNQEGIEIVVTIITCIQKNRDYLSEIDGAIGDGDHGINMNKGFTLAKEALTGEENMSTGFQIISKMLMSKIGGSMGPLYGNFFRGLYVASKQHEEIDGQIIGEMLDKAYDNIKKISPAKVNDKTLVDVLDPAIYAYHKEFDASQDVNKALTEMVGASQAGLEATKHMVAKLGRASRLGERSKGHQDAGATSAQLILESFADGCKKLLR